MYISTPAFFTKVTKSTVLKMTIILAKFNFFSSFLVFKISTFSQYKNNLPSDKIWLTYRFRLAQGPLAVVRGYWIKRRGFERVRRIGKAGGP